MTPAPIHTKRWDDPIDPTDGTRILITRFRPRGLKKEDETWAEWFPDLGPTKELHAAAYGKGQDALGWATYRTAYLKQMLGMKPQIAELARRVAAGETITLLCSAQCVRETRCHRSLLKALIKAEIARIS